GRPPDHLRTIRDDAVSRQWFVGQFGKHVVAAGDPDQLRHPADAGDHRFVPFLEIHPRPARKSSGACMHVFHVPFRIARERFGFFPRADQRAQPADVIKYPGHRAMIADPHLDAVRNQFARYVGLDVGKADREIRLEFQDLADLRAGERRDLRFLLARARRPHGKAGNADDAILLAERIKHFGGFFGEADDAARAVHDPVSQCPTTVTVSLRWCGAVRCSQRYTPCQVPSAGLPPCTGTETLAPVRIDRTCAGMSSGPSASCLNSGSPSGASRAKKRSRSRCTSTSAFSPISREQLVWCTNTCASPAWIPLAVTASRRRSLTSVKPRPGVCTAKPDENVRAVGCAWLMDTRNAFSIHRRSGPSAPARSSGVRARTRTRPCPGSRDSRPNAAAAAPRGLRIRVRVLPRGFPAIRARAMCGIVRSPTRRAAPGERGWRNRHRIPPRPVSPPRLRGAPAPRA